LPAVVESYRIPAYGSKDFYAVDMLNRLLSNGNSSRLNKSVKDAEQKAVYVGSFSLPFEHPGLAIAFAIATQGWTWTVWRRPWTKSSSACARNR